MTSEVFDSGLLPDMNDAPRIRVTAPEGGRRLVKASMKDETDINVIVARWRKTGELPMSSGQPTYGDFSSSLDYHACMNRVVEADAAFMKLPSRVRSYCKNDPGEYLDLCLNPERVKEREDLGLQDAQLPEKALLVRLEEPAEPVKVTPEASGKP